MYKTDFGIEKYVNLLGVRHDVMELMREADIFVIPSSYEGLSIAMIEAVHIYNQFRTKSGYLPISTGIGIHTGEVRECIHHLTFCAAGQMLQQQPGWQLLSR